MRPHLATLALACLAPATAAAFPPYRSTDAETADPWVIEARLGLVRITREAGQNTYVAPLVRLNFGLPRAVEIVSELEYRPEDEGLADLAVGAKWVPIGGDLSAGIEALALLPTSSAGGAGVEGSLLFTLRRGRLRLHANAAGFHDARPDPAETGWKGGLLAEARFGRLRPGLELFAKRTGDEHAAVLGGAGLIVNLGVVDLRIGLHAGISDVAADVTASIWLATKFKR